MMVLGVLVALDDFLIGHLFEAVFGLYAFLVFDRLAAWLVLVRIAAWVRVPPRRGVTSSNTRPSWYFLMLLALFRFIVRASSGQDGQRPAIPAQSVEPRDGTLWLCALSPISFPKTQMGRPQATGLTRPP